MIVFFCFFYTAIVFNPEETADNLKKYGGFIPGIRPGDRTAEYIDYVLTRITVIPLVIRAGALAHTKSTGCQSATNFGEGTLVSRPPDSDGQEG